MPKLLNYLFLLNYQEISANGTGIAISHVYKLITHMRTTNAFNTRMDHRGLAERL